MVPVLINLAFVGCLTVPVKYKHIIAQDLN